MPKGKTVFMVDKWETIDGMHNVTWSSTGNLNAAVKNHSGSKATKTAGCKNFRLQRDAIACAKKVGLGLGNGTNIGLDLPTGYKRFTVVGGKIVKG